MQRLKFLFRCVVSLALIFLILRKVSWRDLGSILDHAHWGWAIAGSLLMGCMIVGLAYRWRIFLNEQAIDVTFSRVFALTWAGQCFNSLLPGSTGGDVFKIFQACRLAPERKAAAAGTVLIDRLTALIALVVLAGIGFLLEPAPLIALVSGNSLPLNSGLLCAIASIFLISACVGLYLLRANPWLGRARRTLQAVLSGLHWNGAVAFAFLIAFAIHIMNFLGVYFFARSLQLEISFLQVLLMMPVVLLLVMLPVTINGHGLRELLLIAYLTQMKIKLAGRVDVSYRDAAVALSLLMVVNDLLWSLPGGLHYLARFRLPSREGLALAR